MRETMEAQGQNPLYSTKISTQISYLKTSSHVSCDNVLGGSNQQIDGHIMPFQGSNSLGYVDVLLVPLKTRKS